MTPARTPSAGSATLPDPTRTEMCAGRATPRRLPESLVSYTQCAAVITTVGEISVPEHASLPIGVEIRMNATGAAITALT